MAVERTSTDGYGPAAAANTTPAIAPYPRDQQLADSAPSSAPHHEQQHALAPNHVHSRDAHLHHHRPALPEVDRETFSMLREQVSYNYQCIQQDREAITRFDSHIGQFQSTVMRMLDEFRHDLATRNAPGPNNQPSAQQQGRVDHGDIDVLANQIAIVATKANEIDNLKVQLELIKSKVRRLEQENQALQVGRPNSAASHREPTHESQPSHPPYHGGHGHQHLPPIQTGASTSPTHGRGPPAGYHGPPDQPGFAHREHRPSSGDLQGPPPHRSAEPGPPPPGWRPAGGVAALTPHPSTGSVRSTPHEDSQGPSWAPVNSSQPKRPYDDTAPREHSAPASPKRPKLAPLAPLKPRGSFGDEPPTSHPQQGPPEHYPINTRLPHHDRPPPQLLTTPASATGPMPQNAFKFVATTPHDAPDHWRDSDGLTPTSARGRGRGRGRGMRSRGGREGGRDGHEHGTPEWEQKPHSDWHAANAPAQHQLSPNGYYSTHRPLPPRGVGEASQHEYPLTPIASAVSPSDHSILADGSSGNKKTRTKPIRNADGVLIRKDGRPDMRSVSSANNLRKVHAKKEAERAESDGRTPVSARELAPAQSFANSDDDGDRSRSADMADSVSRSATPKEQSGGERVDGEDEAPRDRSASYSEEKKTRVEHKWISSKYEREGELQEKKRALENGVGDDKTASSDGPVRSEDPRGASVADTATSAA